MNVLCYDPYWTGHHYDYIQHVASLGPSCIDNVGRLSFLVHDSIAEKLFSDKEINHEAISIIPLSAAMGSQFNPSMSLWSSFQQLKLVNKISKKIAANHVVFLYLPDPLQLALSVAPRWLFGVRYSAIMFNPWAGFGKGNIAHYYRWRRHIQRILLTARRNVKNIAIVGDLEAPELLNVRHKTQVFSYIPDPTRIPEISRDVDVQESMLEENISREKRVRLLLFGSLTKRKGLYTVIEALASMSLGELSKIHVTLAGRVPATEIKEVCRRCSMIKALDWNSIDMEFEFVSRDRMSELFNDADYILLPYERTEASSGVLGYAAAYCRPVIAGGGGQVGNLVTQFKLGMSMPLLDSKSLAYTLGLLGAEQIAVTYDRDLRLQFLETRSPSNFVRGILEPIMMGN